MLKNLFPKLREALISVLPVSLIVLVLGLTPLTGLTIRETVVFSVSAVFLIIGIGLFNLGADLAMTPIGDHTGSGLMKTRRTAILLSVCFIMGLLITVAEPDLSVLANQVSAVINPTALIFTVGIGVGLFLVCAVIKIIGQKNLSALLMFFYMVLFAFCALLIENGKSDFLPLAFDSGGVTTGPITVPFIMALGVGIAASFGGSNSGENSFGLVALCSIGPMLAVAVLSLSAGGELTYQLPDYSISDNIFSSVLTTLSHTAAEVARALGLIVAFFLILQFTVLRLPKTKLFQIMIGVIYTFIGLVVFLTAVTIGFMPIGFRIGEEMTKAGSIILVVFGIIIGAVTVLAEPAVHVLNKQVEEITGGTVSKRSMMIALSLGVGASIGLSVLRMIFDFSVLYYLVPGYLIALGLSLCVPGIYTAIAFDSGGVASGPLTSSFVLPLAIGICNSIHGESAILELAFGVVAMVAMTPLITIQALGFRAIVARKVRERITMKRILDAEDEQIIYF